MAKAKRTGAEKVSWRDVKSLSPYANNARIHPAEQIEQIANSIKQFGFNSPILIDGDGGVIAGHGRLAAAQSLGMKTVPVVVLAHLSQEEKRAYILADNRIGENAGWDDGLLNIELKALQIDDVALDALGFTDADLTRLLTLEDEPTDPENEWRGMPEFEQETAMGFRTIMVHFVDQEALDKFAEQVGREIPPKATFMWFPKQVPVSTVDREWMSES